MIRYLANKVRKALPLPEMLDTFLIKSFPTVFFLPHMSYKETQLFEKYSNQGKQVIEFGAGGSTFVFLRKNKKVLSIENNKPYLDFMNSIHYIKKGTTNKQLGFKYVDTGEIKKWGRLKNDLKKDEWPHYYQTIWDDYEFANPDIVLIDGRFRVMCALNAIPHINRKTIVLFHDFTAPKKYDSILQFFDVIDHVGSLYVLKVKDSIDMESLESMKNEFQHDYR